MVSFFLKILITILGSINIAIDTNVLQDKKIFLWGQILKSADFNTV